MAEFVELQMEAGATFVTEIVVRETSGSSKNLTNYLVRSQFRKSYYSSTGHDFTLSISDAANGVVNMSMTAANTSLVRPGRYVYDVEIEDTSNTVTRIFEGILTVLPNATK